MKWDLALRVLALGIVLGLGIATTTCEPKPDPNDWPSLFMRID